MSKFIFWGAGKLGQSSYDELIKTSDFTGDEVVAFVDADQNKWGSLFNGIDVIPPSEIKKIEFDELVITCGCIDEVYERIQSEQLCDIKKVKKDWIYTEELLYTKRQYYKHYNEPFKRYNSSKVEDIVVYSAIIGDYDNLKEPEYVSPHIHYICFTNNRNLKSQNWEIRYIENKNLSNVKLARRIKILPYDYLRDVEARTVVWIDGKCQITDDLLDYINKYKKNSGILCFPHMFRDCIWDEVLELTIIKPEQKRESLIQLGKYLEAGIPFNYGLFETSCLVRDIKDLKIKEMMIEWWDEVYKYSYRDQISLPYIFWNNNYKPDICDLNVENNKWFHKTEHLM